jgi:hypothetical protein
MKSRIISTAAAALVALGGAGMALGATMALAAPADQPAVTAAAQAWQLAPDTSISTGGSFSSRASLLDGSITLQPGVYSLSVSFEAAPAQTTPGAVFPQIMIYDGVKLPDFSNDLFNIGSGSLEDPTAGELSAGDTIDSYYSGSDLITVTSAETLDVYGFGYDSDTGEGAWSLLSGSVTAVQAGAALVSGQVSGLAVTSVTSSSVTVSWDATPGAQGYVADLAAPARGDGQYVTDTSYTWYGLRAGTAYTFFVSAKPSAAGHSAVTATTS